MIRQGLRRLDVKKQFIEKVETFAYRQTLKPKAFIKEALSEEV